MILIIGLNELVELATCAMWNLSLIKQQNGKLLEGDRVFYRTKCSNFQPISPSVFFVCLHFIFGECDFFFFLRPLSFLLWLRIQSCSASSPDLLVTASSLFLRLWLGLVMVAWQTFPGEGCSLVPEHLFYFSEHNQEWLQNRADYYLEVLGFLNRNERKKAFSLK